MGQTRRQFLKTTAVGAGAAASTISFPMVSRGQTKKLVVWWNRGYYKEEDESMLKIAEDFRKQKNVDLDISFTIQEDLRNKIISALTARRGPTWPSASTTTGRSCPSTRGKVSSSRPPT